MFLWNLILRPWHAIRIINQFQKISHPSLTTISLDSVPFPFDDSDYYETVFLRDGLLLWSGYGCWIRMVAG